MSISKNYANKLLDVAFGNKDDVSLPTNLYLGLCANEPNATSGAVTGEPSSSSAPSYARKIVGGSATGNTKYFGPASGAIIQNTKEVQMVTARESWGKMNYWFLSDSASGAAILWGILKDKDTDVQGVDIGEKTVPVFYEGDLKASIDVPLS